MMMEISEYQKEQLDALASIRGLMESEGGRFISELRQLSAPYIDFRESVDAFLSRYLNKICTGKCFMQRRSYCCSKEGIITFFADVVVNAITASNQSLERLGHILQQPNSGYKCVYLGSGGCLWQTKPIGCAMFLCEHASNEVFSGHPGPQDQWRRLRAEAKRFKWPDRPVLFDILEERFIALRCESPLMYLHNSPGLLQVKKKAGLCAKT